MSTELVTIDNTTMFSLVTNGDCAKLTPEQKLQYYIARCDAAGLDSRTQPFEFINMKGKIVLYAKKECSNQLAANHGVACEVVSQTTEEGIRTVVVRARSKDGRQTDEIGCVNVGSLKGDDLCNAYMKAVTKAKRRAILSICGLGMLDETELETVPNIAPAGSVAPKIAPQVLITTEEKMVVNEEDSISPKTKAAREKSSSKYAEGRWKEVVLHFGKNKGTKLGRLNSRSLSWYRDEWKPTEWKGVFKDVDVELRAALDEYAKAREEAKTIQEPAPEVVQPEDLENSDEIPF